MKKYLLLFLMSCLVMIGRAEAKTIDVNHAQVAYMANYSQEYGIWQLVLAQDDKPLFTFEIDAASTKRIAKSYSVAEGSLSEAFYTPDETTKVAITEGSLTLAYVRKDTGMPIYSVKAQLAGEDGNTYSVSADVDVLAYDYMMYLYYEMGAVPFDQCTIQLQDAPAEESGTQIEVACAGGNWEDYVADMGVLKITAEDESGRMVQMLFDADAIETGTYKLSDTYAAYCYLADLEAQKYDAYFMSGEAQIQVTGKVMVVNARLLAKNGDVYMIYVPIVVPEGEDYHEYIDDPSGIASLMTSTRSASKCVKAGRVLIIKDNSTYDLSGKQIR